jgi:uncharacterized cupin superfamily protein
MTPKLLFVSLAVTLSGAAVGGAIAADVAKPFVVKRAEVPNAAFARPDAKKSERNGNINLEVIRSGDKKMFGGLYKSGPSKFKTDGYGHDEFMYFLEGSVTLTSEDGTVQQIVAGDSASIPKGWKGTWDSPGYVKYYVIYEDKEAQH